MPYHMFVVLALNMQDGTLPIRACHRSSMSLSTALLISAMSNPTARSRARSTFWTPGADTELGQLDDAGFPAQLDAIPDRKATGRARSGLGGGFAHPLVELELELVDAGVLRTRPMRPRCARNGSVSAATSAYSRRVPNASAIRVLNLRTRDAHVVRSGHIRRHQLHVRRPERHVEGVGVGHVGDEEADDFAEHRDSPDVPGPYYGGPDGFEDVYRILERSCRGLQAEQHATPPPKHHPMTPTRRTPACNPENAA